MAGFFKYDQNSLFKGAVRVLFAPTSVTKPAKINDIIDMTSPYAVKTGWVDLGATTGAFQYSRNVTEGSIEIQQTSEALLPEPESTTRQFSVPVGEIKGANLSILEESPGAATPVTAATGIGAQTGITYGSINSFTTYRVAFIGRRAKAQGLVTEPGAVTRGALLANVAFYCTIAADNAQVSFDKGGAATVPLTFNLKPDPTATVEGAETGLWLFETAPATIS